jgi:hypothetical protein
LSFSLSPMNIHEFSGLGDEKWCSIDVFSSKGARMSKLPVGLYTAEGQESASQTKREAGVPDPSVEKGLAAINANSLDQKPADCTCAYPQERVRNMVGHPTSCRAYARLAKELGIIQ